MLLLLPACAAEPAPVTLTEPPPVDYEARKAAALGVRDGLAERKHHGEDVRDEARDALLGLVRDELVPAWYGTPWAFEGTTEVPGSGSVACGYFVSTVLRDAGLGVDRVELAKQPSGYIAATFAGPDVTWFRDRPIDEVLAVVEGSTQPLWVVGFDFHVGLLVRGADGVAFCHASWLDEADVRCEDPRTSPAFRSRVHAIGPVLTDAVVDAWLDGTPLPTVTRGAPTFRASSAPPR